MEKILQIISQTPLFQNLPEDDLTRIRQIAKDKFYNKGQTVFSEGNCIECDACTDICPTSCISFVQNAPEDELRLRLEVPAENENDTLVEQPTTGTSKA